MNRVGAVAALAITVLLRVGTQASAWTPPIGIPAPPFALDMVAPAVPSPWTGAVTGFYYIDNTSGAATDTSNPNGWPAQPRLTIPTTIPAGSVVEVHGGPYIYPSGAGFTNVTANGTASRWVWIRGIGRPVIKGIGLDQSQQFIMAGDYYVFEGFLTNDGTGMHPQFIGNNVLIRNNLIYNQKTPPSDQTHAYYSNGLGIFAPSSNVVIYNNHISYNGNYLNIYDDKVHGIKFSSGTSPTDSIHDVWVLNNAFDHNSGQGMQI